MHMIGTTGRLLFIFSISLLIFTTIIFLRIRAASAETWSAQVDVWNPPLNNELKRDTAIYTPLEGAAKPWRIFAFIPHLKDSYWLSANYGLISEAKCLGIQLIIYEAGGYENLKMQQKTGILQVRFPPEDFVRRSVLMNKQKQQQGT